MTTLVRQEHDYGCGLASLAMIDGTTYDAVREWLLANWPGGHERPDEWLVKRGIYSGLVDWYLSQHGYVWRTLYSGWQMPEWPPSPFAPVHLAMVRQPSGNSHYVVMRADGVVLDPLADQPRTLADWEKVDNVRGIWPCPTATVCGATFRWAADRCGLPARHRGRHVGERVEWLTNDLADGVQRPGSETRP